ncbi:AAT family amino acid transporter [Nemania serpens]|nr:AAT family amino acid transporter [Nemania serpens]
MADIEVEANHQAASKSGPTISHEDLAGAEKAKYERRNVGTLERGLKSRHVQFMALSGAIGTGLFIGSGQVLSLAGPLSAFLAYLITAFNVYCVVHSLGEMATYLPLPGAVPLYAARYVDEALGFAVAWNYWWQIAIGVPIEVTVSVVIVDYWPNDVPTVALITLFLFAMVVVNCFPVRVYGEAEFVFGAVKLTTIVGLILLMLIITLGGTPNGERIGFRYWQDPGPMNEYLVTGTLGRFLAFWKVFIQATFSYGGSEMVVIASGETENPRRNIPKAIRRVFWRISLFYVLGIFLVTLCVSSTDPRLLDAIQNSAPGAAASPFVIAIANSGIAVLPSIINAVILTSAWSAGSSFFYASTRVLYAAALDGKAPRFLTFERWGVPYACVAATTLLSLLCYLNVNNRGESVFFWFSSLSAVSTLIVWSAVCVTYLRFYHGLRHNGISRDSLPYKAPLQPFLAYFALCFCVVVAFFNGFDAFFPGKFSAKTFVPPYVDVPIFLALFLGYKLVRKTRLVPLAEMDLWSGKEEIDQLEGSWPEVRPKNFMQRIWFWIA